MSDKNYRLYTGPLERAKAVSTLRGIVKGINLDKVHNELELKELRLWFNSHFELFVKKPLDELGIIINNSLSGNTFSEEVVEDILWFCNNLLEGELSYFDRETQAIQSLHGLMYGILSDGVIKDTEIVELNKWLDKNKYLEALYPYDELNSLVFNFLADGVIDEDEQLILKTFFAPFVNLHNGFVSQKIELEIGEVYEIKGYCAVDPSIIFSEHFFCLTGEFVRSQQIEVENIIVSAGGIVNKNLSSKINYLIVGTNGNPCWAYSSYGRKVQKAMEWRKKGKKMQIIHEDDFWKIADNL